MQVFERGQTRELRDFILRSVRCRDPSDSDIGDGPDQEARRRLLEIAEIHGVVPLVRRRLAAFAGGGEAAAGDLDPTTALATATHLRALGDLASVGDALRRPEVRWVIMKGPASSELMWARPEDREYTDLDVLVSPLDLEPALDALTGSGFELLERNWDLLLDRRRGQIHLRAPHGTLVDLHWDLIAEGDLRDLFRIDTGAMLDRSTEARIGSTPVRVFEPIDRLLHLALHACLSGAHRLIWLMDVEAACAAPEIHWDALVERAHAASIGPLVGLVLRRTNSVLDTTAAPLDVIRALESNRSWRWATHLGDAATSPVPLQDGSFRKLIARATRPNASESWLALLRSASSQASTRLATTTPGDLRDASYEGSMLFEAGGEAGRREYIRWVTDRHDPPGTIRRV